MAWIRSGSRISSRVQVRPLTQSATRTPCAGSQRSMVGARPAAAAWLSTLHSHSRSRPRSWEFAVATRIEYSRPARATRQLSLTSPDANGWTTTGPAPGTHRKANSSSTLRGTGYGLRAAAPLAHAHDYHQQIQAEQQHGEIQPAGKVEP